MCRFASINRICSAKYDVLNIRQGCSTILLSSISLENAIKGFVGANLFAPARAMQHQLSKFPPIPVNAQSI
jgi:hypothetical protein